MTKPVSFVSKIIKFSIPSWVGFLVNIGSTIVVTRYFLPDAFGLISTFNAAATLVMSLVCLGLDSGFIRYFHETPDGFDRNRLLLFSLSAPILILLTIAALTLVAWSSQLSIFILGVDNYFAVALLFANVAELIIIRFFTIYYRMQGNVFLYGLLTISMQLALKGALVFAAIIQPDYEFAILSSVAAITFMIVAFYIFYGRKLLPSNKTYSVAEIKSLRPFVLYSLYSWPIPVILYANILATQIIIRTKLGDEAVGIFTSVNFFIGIISVIQAGFVTFWSGFMFENYKSQYAKIIRMHDFISLALIMVMCLFVLFREPMFYLVGKNYQTSKPFFALLLLYPLLLTLSETTSYGISIAKKSNLMFLITLVCFILNIGIGWLLIPSFGIVGACIGSAVSAVVFFALQSYFGQKYYRSIENTGRLIFTVSSLVLLACGNLFLSNSPWLAFFLYISIFLLSIFVFRKEMLEIRLMLLGPKAKIV
jgi:O-antigen/teichoic acid export membrane protein